MKKEIISEYYLERYVLGELPDEEAEEIRQLAATDPKLRATLEDIEASNRDILALYPPLTVKTSLLTRLNEATQKPFPLRRILYLSSAFVTAVLILILILPGLMNRARIKPSEAGPDVSLVKGIPKIDLSKTQLLVYRKIQNQVEILTDGKRVKPGDLLQLAYVAAKEPYGLILSIDGRGAVTLHFPAKTEESTELELNKKALLPNAIELDDAPGFERFFFITSVFPIKVDEILKKAENLAKDPEQMKRVKLDLPEGIKQYSVLLLKGGKS